MLRINPVKPCLKGNLLSNAAYYVLWVEMLWSKEKPLSIF